MTNETIDPGNNDGESGTREKRADAVFRALLEQISSVHLKPGDALNKDDIAAELGVSRQPVTDAVNRLAAMGLVTIVPQVSTCVARISAPEVLASAFLRSAVEAQVVHELASRPRPATIDSLRGQLAEQARLLGREDIDGFHDADDAFHRLLAELAGLPALWEQTAPARLHLSRVRRLGLPRAGRMAVSYAEHTLVVDEIEAGRPRKAANAISRHIRYNEGELRRIQKEHPQYCL